MKHWQGIGTLLLAASMAHGCNLLPNSASIGSRPTVTTTGMVRQFNLPQGDPTHLDLGSAKRMLLAVSASESTAPSFQFRIQSSPPHDESRFQQSTAALLAEPGALPLPAPRRIQAGGAPTETFWVNIGDSTLQGDRAQTASLRLTTPHAYVYLDSQGASDVTADQLMQLANTFETQIYPTVTSVFGADPRTDLNGDSRVYIVLSPAVDNFNQDKGLLGYFWSRDLLSVASAPSPRSHSNQKKVIFLTSRIFSQQPYTTFGTLAHEFTHLVIFNQKVLAPNRTTPEATWLDEGWAMLAMDLCGYGLRGGNDEIAKDIKSFQDQPSAYSLTDWARNPHGFSYGLSYLFTRYLYDRFGADIVRSTLAYPAVGQDSLQGSLTTRSSNFRDLFADWAIANAISGLGYSNDKRFQYASDINLRGTYGATTLSGIKPKAIATFPQDLPETLRPWGTAYYDLNASSNRSWSFDFRNPMALFGSAVLLN